MLIAMGPMAINTATISAERCSLNAGTRIVRAFASHGPESGTNPFLLKGLRALGAAGRSGLVIDVVLLLSHPLKSPLHIDGLRHVRPEVFYGAGHELISKWYNLFIGYLQEDRYDLYGFAEHDILLGNNTMQAMCTEFNRLAGTRYFPGTLRFERLHDHAQQRLLTDNSLCCPPQIRSVVTVNNHRYIVPYNPYQAMFFMPAADLNTTLSEYSRRRGPAPGPNREHWSTFWLHSGLRQKVVPLDRYEAFLVEHQGGRYAKGIRGHLEEHAVDVTSQTAIIAYLSSSQAH